ncbi:MAG: hypothetical protein HRF44_00360 [Ignavibacterium sp.]|jgi:small-conductance mechanosensitive channel
MEWINKAFQPLKEILGVPVFKLGAFELTVGTLLYLLFFTALILYLSGKIKRWTTRILAKRSSMDVGRREAAGAITSYVFLVIGFLVVIQTAGIDLTTLNVLAGASA